MDIKLLTYRYVIKKDKNLANLEIHFFNDTYEIYRRAIKTEKFVDKIKEFAEQELKKYKANNS